VLTSTVVTPIRLYPLNYTLYCCTLTRRQSSKLVALSSAFVSDFFFFQVLQCTLRWLQLSQHFLLAILLRNHQFFPKFIFLLEVSRELPQRSTLNTSLVALSNLRRAGYIPGDRLTSWVYSTTCIQYLYISCYLSDNKPVLSYLLLCLLLQSPSFS
jgi:hypothetical protein